MKKQIKTCVCGSLLYILSANISFAQDETFKELPPVTISATSSHSVVSARVNKAFEKMFTDVSNIRWFKLNEKFMVLFIQNDQENRALFSKNGQVVYHICYGLEKNLPSEIRHLVKSHYYDQAITWVYKVNQDDRNIWVINVEDEKAFIFLRVEDLALEETIRYDKIK